MPRDPARKAVGAPLGTYTGLDLAFAEPGTNRFFLISGTMKPFTSEELRTRYPSQQAYVAAVTAAAEDLVAKRQILSEDADAYIAAARAADLGH